MDGDEKEDAVESRATMLKKVIIIILIVVLQGGYGYGVCKCMMDCIVCIVDFSGGGGGRYGSR
jgi:hypothetical protein